MNAAYKAAVRVAASFYDPHELKLRNEREGIAARRLAQEHSNDLHWLWAEAKGSLYEDEYPTAEQARKALAELSDRIGERNFSEMVRVWRDEILIEGVDY